MVDHLWQELPPAVRACRCAGIDVDALEGLVLHVTASRSYEVAWLQIRLAPGGTVIPVQGSVQDLVVALSALTAEQRAAGITFASP
jgi:hypothetical protein